MEYDNQITGHPPPAEFLRRFTTPEALRARAAIRLEIAKQDAALGDSYNYMRNISVATDMERRSQGDKQ